MKFHNTLHSVIRIAMGWIMLWPFLDKTFGLGFSTKAESAWINGGSPTTGFLSNAVRGPFAEFFSSLSASPVVDWLFMLGLLGVGLAFLLGISIRFTGYVGATMMTLMYLALIPPSSNPIIDDHIIYALIFLLIAHSNAGEAWGLQKWWRKTSIVKSLPFLR